MQEQAELERVLEELKAQVEINRRLMREMLELRMEKEKGSKGRWASGGPLP